MQEGVQTYGGVQIYGGIQTYREGIQTYGGIQTYRGHPNISGYPAKRVLPLVNITSRIDEMDNVIQTMEHRKFVLMSKIYASLMIL